MHPPLWPVFGDALTPVLSQERLARRAARRHREGQGVVVSFADRTARAAGPLEFSVNGVPVARLDGTRRRPWFVELALVPAHEWTVRALLRGRTASDRAATCEVVVAPEPRRVEWLHFTSDGSTLAVDVRTIRSHR